MTDSDFWKHRYQQTWESAKGKETLVRQQIEELTGQQVEEVGLGAGSDDFLSGNAASYGKERGGADLHVVGTNVYIEVTGPLSPKVDGRADLWLRPDKVQNAKANHPDHDTWVVHRLAKDGTTRVIHLTPPFFRAVEQGLYPIVRPTIRGTVETYVSVPATSRHVEPFQVLVDHLRTMA